MSWAIFGNLEILCPYMYGSGSFGLILLSLTNKIVMASEPIRMKQFSPLHYMNHKKVHVFP